MTRRTRRPRKAPRWRDEVHRMEAERRRARVVARARALAERPTEDDVAAALAQLARVKGDKSLEAFTLWTVEDMRPEGRAAELASLRRAVDAGEATGTELSQRLGSYREAGAAASLIGVGRARSPEAATFVAAMQLGKRGYSAREAAATCSRMHVEYTIFCTERGLRERGEHGGAIRWSFERQLRWIRAAREG